MSTAPKVFILPDYKQDLCFDPIGSSTIIQFDLRVYLVHQDMLSHYRRQITSLKKICFMPIIVNK